MSSERLKNLAKIMCPQDLFSQAQSPILCFFVKREKQWAVKGLYLLSTFGVAAR